MPDYEVNSLGEKYTVTGAESYEDAKATVANQQAGNAMVGGFLAVVLFGPIIAGKIVGLLWGLLLKLGIAGRILTTLLLVVIGPLLVLLILALGAGELLRYAIGPVASAILMVGSALIIPTWYFLWHYETVKVMGALTFSDKAKNFCKWLWWGFLAATAIALFKGDSNPGTVDMIRGVIATGTSTLGLIFYFLGTRGYAKQAAANPTMRIPLAVKGIVMAIALVLTVIYGFAAKDVIDQRRAGRATEQAGGIGAQPARNKAQRNMAAFFTADKPFMVYGPYEVYEIASEQSEVIGNVKRDDILIAMGDVLFVPGRDTLAYVSIKFNGGTGWVGVMNIKGYEKSDPIDIRYAITNTGTRANTSAESATSNNAQTQQATAQTAAEAASLIEANDTDYAIEELNVTPAESEDW